jgi:biopolymer transport protein ExbD
MAFSHSDDCDEGMNEINMTPLVDVMLVLLIIFIVTMPVMKHAVDLDLPRVSSKPLTVLPEVLRLSVIEDGDYFLDNVRVSDTELLENLRQRAAGGSLPAVEIQGDKNVRYERIAFLLSLVQKAGISRIGFVTQNTLPEK